MKSGTRTILIFLLAILGLVITVVIALMTYYLLQPRPANAQNVAKKKAAIQWSGNGLKLELQAQPLDVVRAFFLGRGFAANDADLIATSGCIFRSAIGNSSDKPNDPTTTVLLANWKVTAGEIEQAPKTREEWAEIWDSKQVSNNAKTAFHWALFPTQQAYQASDYNWGMISFALPPGTKFDLKVHWLTNGKTQTKILKNLECGQ